MPSPLKMQQLLLLIAVLVRSILVRSIVNTVNGRTKGPAIFVRQENFLEVKVTNNTDAGLSIKSHGVEPHGLEPQLYDGHNGLVQGASAPGESMTY